MIAGQNTWALGLRGFWLAQNDPEIRVLMKYPG
jgi:hypothetical protein